MLQPCVYRIIKMIDWSFKLCDACYNILQGEHYEAF